MNNERFHWLLQEPRDARGRRLRTVEKVADAIFSGRAHVCQVLSNKPGRGHVTRRKLVTFFKANFANWREVLDALGWDEDGTHRTNRTHETNKIVPQGTSHMEQKQEAA